MRKNIYQERVKQKHAIMNQDRGFISRNPTMIAI